MRVFALSGSLRVGSYNTSLARAAAMLAPAGVAIELYEGLGELPPYDQDWTRAEPMSRPPSSTFESASKAPTRCSSSRPSTTAQSPEC